MPADVENMMSVRQVPWHGVGTIVEEAQTAAEALKLSGMDYEVGKYPLWTSRGEVLASADRGADFTLPDPIDVPGSFATIREDTGVVMGVVGSRYTVLQNSKCFSFFDQLVEDDKAKYETAGVLDEGRTVFLTAKFPETMMVGGVDAVDMHLAMANSHDASMSFTAMVTPVRIVCRNTLNLAIGGATQKWAIRHTALDGEKGLEAKVAEARKALDLTFKYQDEFQKMADRLIEEDFGKAQFESFVRDLVPDKEREKVGMFSDRQAGLLQVFTGSETVDDSFRFTKWGALNAVGEYMDWGRTRRASTNLPEARVTDTLFGDSAKLRDKALQMLVAI